MFGYNFKLKEIGKLSNLYPMGTSYLFVRCEYLRHLPEFENLNLSYAQTNVSSNNSYTFAYNYSLREIPENLLKQLHGVQTNAKYTVFYNGFVSCLALDEIVGLNPQTGTLTENAFVNTFESCYRLKNIIFATQDDGTPYPVKWKSQTINLSNVGCGESDVNVVAYFNSGITTAKRVTNDATYQALKNDQDWYAGNINYSRYNHDSAVNTINSLPDTSAYLASVGGTNTIKFKGESGKLTDGGAINTLTEAEIAVATAKGWTVTFV